MSRDGGNVHEFRTVIAIVAMILVAAAMQTVAKASGEPARMPGGTCPPQC